MSEQPDLAELLARYGILRAQASTDLHWFKSSHSGDQGECVEMAPTPTTIHIRDSKHPTPTLKVTPTTWTTFLHALA